MSPEREEKPGAEPHQKDSAEADYHLVAPVLQDAFAPAYPDGDQAEPGIVRQDMAGKEDTHPCHAAFHRRQYVAQAYGRPPEDPVGI